MASKDPKQKKHLEKSMNEELSLMHALSQDSATKGLRKHQAKLEKDFKEYQKDPSDENYAKIKHDITELRDFCAE